MESVSVHSYHVGKWLVKPAPGGEAGPSGESRLLEAGGVSETLAALTLAEARVSATGEMREHAAAAVEDVVFGSSPSPEPPIEAAVKQAAGDLHREEPPAVSVDAVAVASPAEDKKEDSASAKAEVSVPQTLPACDETASASQPGAAEARASGPTEFYDAQSDEVVATETKGEPHSAEGGVGISPSSVISAVASAAERAAAAIGLVSKGE